MEPHLFRRLLGGAAMGLAVAAAVLAIAAVLVSVTRAAHNAQQLQAALHRQCEREDTRHSTTLRTVKGIYRQALKAEPDRAAKLASSERVVILIVDALAPHEDCATTIPQS